MKTFVTVLFAGVLAATGATAQSRASDNNADFLNSRVLDALRTQQNPPQFTVVSSPAAQPSHSGFFVGGSLGYGGPSWGSPQWSNTLSAGYEFNRVFAVEGTVDFNYRNATRHGSTHEGLAGQALFVNAIFTAPTGRLAPYALLGAGAGFSGSGNANRDPIALWNYGGGLVYRVSDRWSLDGRYRRVESVYNDRAGENAFSLGVNYRF